MNWSTAMMLGRVSNLPTVWTNVLAGVVLAGATLADARLPLLLLALSLCYVAGMFLNDAFDRGFDAQHRPERPIPAGRVTAAAVFTSGFAMLALGICVLAWVGYGFSAGTQWRPVAAGLALAAAIVLYDIHHKGNPLSPVIMGLCRMLVYVTAAAAVADSLRNEVLVAALLLLSYLVGLTYIAKQEHLGRVRNLWPLLFLALPMAWGLDAARVGGIVALCAILFAGWTLFALNFLRRRRPGDVPRAVGCLLAGICLWDALVIAAAGQAGIALLAVSLFALTLLLQRFIAPT